MFVINNRINACKDSPFAPHAKDDNFMLWNVKTSYKLLKDICNTEENYYDMAETLAKKSPELAKSLYQILRKGMEEEPKNHNNIIHAIENVTNPNSDPLERKYVIGLNSSEESE